jgi:hypothetical protein
MNFMSMESLGGLEFNSIVYFPSFGIKSGSNLRLIETLICAIYFISFVL